MRARRQNRNESIMVYFHEKVRMCHAVSLTLSELRDYIIRGVYQRDLAMYALRLEHQD